VGGSSAVPEAPWRVAIVTRILPVLVGFDAVVRDAGHEPVALLTFLDSDGRYGGFDLTPSLREVPPGLDVLMPSKRSSIAPLLRSVEPDLVVCMGFPWRIPEDALAVPPLGWLNGHPSKLPRYRGPSPVAWAIRNGDTEIGVTVHKMEAELDTGAIMAQRTLAIGDDYIEPEELYGRAGPLFMEALAESLAKLAAGDPGIPQEGGDYQSFLPDEDAWLDPSGPALDAHRLVWAWRYAIPRGTYGALLELDGETVRVLASSLREVDGARRVDFADGPLWLLRTEVAD
jgi:methionyl-tRNA formyltransferase